MYTNGVVGLLHNISPFISNFLGIYLNKHIQSLKQVDTAIHSYVEKTSALLVRGQI